LAEWFKAGDLRSSVRKSTRRFESCR